MSQNKSVTITIGLSTNPQVHGRYFADLRDTTGATNNQLTTWTSDTEGVLEFIASVKRHAEPLNVEVLVNDTTKELGV